MTDLISTYPVTIYNSLKRRKEPFTPVNPGRVGLYLCGPTVYGDPHLGHARSALTFDIVFRLFRHLGYKVRYVRNVTDVGHLEDDLHQSGEDKIAKKARLEQLEPMEVAEAYTHSYHRAMDRLNILRPSIEPRATGHIIEQIELVKAILAAGFAYEVNGSVYFDVEKYAREHDYGTLSGKVLEELQSDSRGTAGQSDKRSPMDFALWKKAAPEHLMQWPSPWGQGFPGWHTECTAMSTKYLGIPFDIHGGGLDLQFPHHEAEIAQGVTGCGHAPVNYWMHNNMLTIDGQKMAKSIGNFITLDQLFSGDHPRLSQAFSPMTVRFFFLQAHYRSALDFSDEALKGAERGYQKLMNILQLTEGFAVPEGGAVDEKLESEVRGLLRQVYQELCDDFNTARAMATVFEIGSRLNALRHGQIAAGALSADLVSEMIATFRAIVVDVLGLLPEDSGDSDRVDGLVRLLIELRADARRKRDFATGDRIRDQLAALGVMLRDDREGGTDYSLETVRGD